MEETDLSADLDAFLARHEDELIAFRRGAIASQLHESSEASTTEPTLA